MLDTSNRVEATMPLPALLSAAAQAHDAWGFAAVCVVVGAYLWVRRK